MIKIRILFREVAGNFGDLRGNRRKIKNHPIQSKAYVSPGLSSHPIPCSLCLRHKNVIRALILGNDALFFLLATLYNN